MSKGTDPCAIKSKLPFSQFAVFKKLDLASISIYRQFKYRCRNRKWANLKGYFGCGMVFTCSTGYGLANNGNVRHVLFPELKSKTISKPFGNFRENAILRMLVIILLPVKFKMFSVFLSNCVRQVTCKLKFAEKVNTRKFYAPKFHFCIFLQNIIHG